MRTASGRKSGWTRGRWAAAGFTVMEVAVVLVLLGILAVAAVEKLGNNGARATVEADALRSVLRYAQARAMADVYTWGVSVNTSGYTIFSNNPSQLSPSIPGQGGSTHAFATGVSATPLTTVIFDWRGQPVSGYVTTPGGSATAVTGYRNITLSESGGSTNITVTPYTGFVP